MIFKARSIAGCLLFLGLVTVCSRCNHASAQEIETGIVATPKVVRNEKGLYELDTPRLTLVTDIPIDDELKSWPSLLEQSIEQWQLYFGVDAKRMAGLHVSAFLIGDRERLRQLGLLDGVPGFDEGYQFGNQIYLREQPTTYYRRHLFLHEATHWIMWKLYGGAGAPWFMEGMADLHGTHSMRDGVLKLGVLPSSPEQVSGWGRLRLIDDMLKRRLAPSMSEILAYGNDRTDHEIRYSWSWAACVFFTHHPKYGPILKELYSQRLDYSDSLSFEFKKRLGLEWDDVQMDWNAFVSDLDFGYDFERSMVIRSARPAAKNLNQGEFARIQLASDRGWQSTGVIVEVGKPLRISCSGGYIIRKTMGGASANWDADPSGITYRYYRGNPLGCVIASVVSKGELEQTRRWQTIRIGGENVITTSNLGELFLKINEPSNELWNNAGEVSVEISVTKP